jgi:photolyase PhrII
LSTVPTPETLPTHLAERVTVHSPPGRLHPAGAFVVYWMRTAVRAHENPALDTALTIAQALGLPVFVYHALSERYPYASDRHHTFILEGARDVAAECAARGIGYAFHLERPGHRSKALQELAERAALVVTETFPAPPLDWLTESLADAAPCPVWSVDAACIVPMPLVRKAHTRAYAYRDATEGIRATRQGLPWREVAVTTPAFVPDPLPFKPVDWAAADIEALVADCAIDHGVPPVRDTPGGTVAGYARWNEFVRSGRLARYAADRNDPLRHGVSRMSAYLHYGMVSPFRLVRDCLAMGGEGPEKYLDELLVWREVAYAFCYWHEDPTGVEAIPGWARETLDRHGRDPRPLYSWEQLARGQTGDALWDAAQRSLLRQGELHNNVRMTWGKALVGWTRDADEALERLVDLNHRYALDGRDPASYGGLLWCLGQFDRPFTPELPVLGTVRPRPTREHARRLDVSRYAAHTDRGDGSRAARVLVIGAGLAGLSCARALRDQGVAVTVLDKGRGVGGRLATRREGAWRFDHGAPVLHAFDSRLQPFLASWTQDGLLASAGDGEWLGTPAMTALPKHLASELAVQTGVQVISVAREGTTWTAVDARGGRYDAEALVLAMPAPQAVALLGTAAPSGHALRERLATVQMAPCWSTMVCFDSPPSTRVVARLNGRAHAFNDGPLARCLREADKPGRSSEECWVVQGSAAWSAAMLELEADAVAREVASALGQALEMPSPAIHAVSHRWRYARVATGLPVSCLWDEENGLGAAGDFANGPEGTHRDAEAAWLSGIALAGRMLAGRPTRPSSRAT